MNLPYWIYKNLEDRGIKYKPVKAGGVFYYGDKTKFVPYYEIEKANKYASMRYCSEKEKVETFLEWIGILKGDLNGL